MNKLVELVVSDNQTCSFYCFFLIDFDRFICFYLPASLLATRLTLATRLPRFNKLELS